MKSFFVVIKTLCGHQFQETPFLIGSEGAISPWEKSQVLERRSDHRRGARVCLSIVCETAANRLFQLAPAAHLDLLLSPVEDDEGSEADVQRKSSEPWINSST
ncbi:unnamed protein product [Schistocephalus solidus]|uniref:CBM20 domain-containing protein n=1 Tax=Schistocephalus solidus TaxID=70667 RepID=A0A183SIX9_SCHSO|nr:unnamed protein product [Schistocephalus solidus]